MLPMGVWPYDMAQQSETLRIRDEWSQRLSGAARAARHGLARDTRVLPAPRDTKRAYSIFPS